MEPNAEQGASVGDDIRASIAALQEKDSPPVVTPDPAPVVTDKTPAAKPVVTDKAAPVVTDKTAAPVTDRNAVKEPAKITDTPPVTTQKTTVNQGPRSWKPEVREKWAGLPAEVQAEVTRREQEVTRVLQETARTREFAERFYEMSMPYQQLIALEGGDPLTSFGNYLKTATVLRSGSPTEKANAVAQAIHSYGVDIQMLDGALAQTIAGRGPVQQGGQQQQQFKDPRVDELLGRMNQRQQQEEAQMAEELANEVIDFAQDPANEFFEDVRMDVSVLLGVAAERKQKMTLKEAYDKACKLHPDISKVVEQRAAAKSVAEAKAAELARRNAGSSITGGSIRQTGTANDASSSVRAAIEDSIARLQS